MIRLKHVHVGVDFSEFSALALAQATRIARWNDARLTVVHVIDETVVRELQSVMKGLSPDADVREDVLKSATERVEAMVDAANASSENTTVEVVIGAPFVEIVRRVHDSDCELLVLGANGASGLRTEAGTLATKCVRKSTANTLLVRAMENESHKNIVACVDFSDTSEQVITYALRAAEREQAKVHVLHVFAAPWNVLHYRAPTTESSPDFRRQYLDSLRGCLEKLMQPFQEDLKKINVQEHLLESTYPAAEILSFVDAKQADLVVVASRGRTGLRAILMGTTAERIVRESRCSVLAIKPHDFEYPIG